jgi:hypothetical protein
VQRLRVCVHVRSRVHDMLGSGSLRWVKKALKARKGITCKRPSRPRLNACETLGPNQPLALLRKRSTRISTSTACKSLCVSLMELDTSNPNTRLHAWNFKFLSSACSAVRLSDPSRAG